MSDRINELISNVKQFIQDEQRPKEECIKSIENEIDSKENQIRELFAQNIDSVIAHFLKYHQTLFHHRRIETQCQQFSKHIEKSQKLNAYDEQQIDKIQKNLEFMKGIKNRMSQYRNQVKLAKSIVLNLKQQKYNKAIKSINEYKEAEIKKETPLKGVLPIAEKRIQSYLKKLLDSFWEQNFPKMKDIGKTCFQKMSSNYQQKMNIYQIFFGNNMSRSTIMNRNSMSAFRCTVLNKQNSSRIMKSYDQSSVQYLNKVMVRVSVEMSALKKVKVMVVQLDNQAIFNQMLRTSIKNYLGFIEENHACEKEQHFIDLLSFLIGYLLIKKEISAFFDISLDQKIFLKQIYLLIGKQIKRVIQIAKNVEIIVSLKDNLLIFHRILTLLDLNENNQNYNQIINEVIKLYNARNLQIYQELSSYEISKDNLTHFQTKDQEKDSLIRQMLDIGNQQFKFTSYVTFVMEYILKTYNEITSLLEESDIGKNYIYQAISDLYDRVLKIYGSQVLGKDQHYQIIQGQVNIIHLNKIYRYMIRQLQIYHGIISTNKLNDKYQQLIVKLTRNILEVIRQKLSKLMEDYNSMSNTLINQSYNQFVEWTLQFILHIIIFMKQINCPNYQQVSIETMRQMCQLYWDYLKNLKEINLVIIYNLDLDLSFIYRFCSKNFTGNMGILDKFKSLREFYALMLTNNINDFLQPQKKQLSYPNLNIQLIIPMLKKYSQAKSTNGKIRDLKKKDVQNVVKKLVQNSK